MLREQLCHEFPSLKAVLDDHPGVGDQDWALFSEGLHQAALAGSPPDPVWHRERIGEAHQIRRNLGEAARWYRRVLDDESPREPNEAEREAMVRHTPLLLTQRTEFFPLKDIVAIHHPQRPLIAYHLFWEDDYNFPDDLEPCDHEQLWVAYDPVSGAVTSVWSFFHSQILTSTAAVTEARAHGRPRIRVEWGLHGSLVAGWEALAFDQGSPRDWLQHNFCRVIEGGRVPDHPLKRLWPRRFEGTWDDYQDFSLAVDPRELLERHNHLWVGRWANALLQQHCLAYNFAVKFDWPWDTLRG